MSEKKVALIGNMNNNLFNLCRYLRDRNFDARLFILPFDPRHFLPDADSYDDEYKNYVTFLAWGNPYELHKTPKSLVQSEFSSFDYLIGCGTAPAYLSYAGLKLDLFAPYGSDLYHYPFYHALRPGNLLEFLVSKFRIKKEAAGGAHSRSLLGYLPFVYHQKNGIREASACAVHTSGIDIYGQALKSLRFSNTHWLFSAPMLYAPQYSPAHLQEAEKLSEHFESFAALRNRYEFIIFHNCRHCWKNEPDPASFKGNDRLIKGFASFLKETNGNAAIVTFEYGSDFRESQKLADSLGIAEHIHWFPLLARKDLMLGMSMADIVVGNLSDQSWATYGVVYESMALHKPLMHNRQDALYSPEMHYQMIQANDAETVKNALVYYSIRPKDLRSIGENAHQWFMKYCVNDPVDQIAAHINRKNID